MPFPRLMSFNYNSTCSDNRMTLPPGGTLSFSYCSSSWLWLGPVCRAAGSTAPQTPSASFQRPLAGSSFLSSLKVSEGMACHGFCFCHIYPDLICCNFQTCTRSFQPGRGKRFAVSQIRQWEKQAGAQELKTAPLVWWRVSKTDYLHTAHSRATYPISRFQEPSRVWTFLLLKFPLESRLAAILSACHGSSMTFNQCVTERLSLSDWNHQWSLSERCSPRNMAPSQPKDLIWSWRN